MIATRAGAAWTHLCVSDAPLANAAAQRSLDEGIVELLSGDGHSVPRTEIRARLRVNNQRLGDVLTRLEKLGRLRRTARGWGGTLDEDDAAW